MIGVGGAWLVAVGLIVWQQRRDLKANGNPALRFQITDFWAALLGLLPTYLAVGYVQRSHANSLETMVPLLIFMALNQSVGIFLGVCINAMGREKNGAERSRLNDAYNVFFYTLCGLFIPLLMFIVLIGLGVLISVIVLFVYASIQYPGIGVAAAVSFIAMIWLSFSKDKGGSK